MNTDRLLAWVGVAIGILGLIPIFRDASVQLQIAYSILLVLMLVIFVILYNYGRGPNYETTLMKKILNIENKDGTLAEIHRVQSIRVRYGNLEGIWWKGNIGDGSLTGYKVDGSDPDIIQKAGGVLSFYKAFNPPLAKGQTRTIYWSLRANDSFTATQESFLHETIPYTKALELEINFPDNRLCKNPTFHVEVAGNFVGAEEGLKYNGGGKQLAVSVRSPRPGNTYCITWQW